MSRDHFIPATYLRKFGDPKISNRLHIYRKRTLKHSIEAPQNVCLEKRGDFNRYFNENPRIVREFLKTIEPRWTKSVDKLISDPFDLKARYVVSGLMAYITSWSPTARRTLTDVTEGTVEVSRPIIARHVIHTEQDKTKAENIAKTLLNPGIRVEVDPDFSRAIALSTCLGLQANFFQGDWLVLRNDTDQPFITSDYPTCKKFSESDDQHGISYFPLTPKWAVIIGMDPSKFKYHPNLRQLRAGETRPGTVNPEAVPELNELVVMSAEDQVICNGNYDWVFELVRKYKKWRMEALFDNLPTSNGTYQISRLRPAQAK